MQGLSLPLAVGRSHVPQQVLAMPGGSAKKKNQKARGKDVVAASVPPPAAPPPAKPDKYWFTADDYATLARLSFVIPVLLTL
eukprot:SAG22_NODE_13836_length_393_cov_1.061224_1_plen_81_part_01